MSTAIDVIGFLACLFGMFATFKAVIRFCRTDGRGTWWGGPAFVTSLFAIPALWFGVMVLVDVTGRALFPVQL